MSTSITVNGQSCVPPGFRFHPTEEELLNYYLRKKVASQKIDLDVIRDVDLNKLEPWDIQDECKIGSSGAPQNDWYFFSHKDKKYPTGTRTNRATAAGFWKATGRDKVIYTSSSTTSKRIGMRKTLVFYKGRAPRGQKSDWIMHEYRLDDDQPLDDSNNASCSIGDSQEDGWVVCRVFKKKNLHKINSSSPVQTGQLLLNPNGDGALDQILEYMGRSCKEETETKSNIDRIFGFPDRFMKLPALEERPLTFPSIGDAFDTAETSCFDKSRRYNPSEDIHAIVNTTTHDQLNYQLSEPGLHDWAVLDRLVASHLNCQPAEDADFVFSGSQGYPNGNGDGDLWSLASTSAASHDHISRMSHDSI